jgi:hypothetical protein
MKLKITMLLLSYCLMSSIVSAEQIVKEETTPPPTEGALTVDQLQPLVTNQSNPAN